MAQQKVVDVITVKPLRNGYGREISSMAEPHEDYTKLGKNMRRRCTEEDKTGCYFNRGIKVCEEWQKDFIPFREWALSHGYQNNLTLDRINVNGNYTPDNCRWITQVEQCNNKRTNRHIVFNNEEHTLAEWSRILGVSYATIKYRANHNLPLINVMSKTGKFDISKKRDSKKCHS